MSVVIVSKSGQSFQTRDGHKNPRGEIAGTQDMIRHLREAGHRVVYFGRHSEDVAAICDAAVQPNTERLDSFETWGSQQKRFADDAQNVYDALDALKWDGQRPPMIIESCGLSASFSFVGNSRCVQPLMSSMRYTAPLLGLLVKLQTPRICLVTDVRSYPRDGEMSDKWPELAPAALLDNTQGGLGKRQRISFVNYQISGRDSRSWSWPYLEWLEPAEEPMLDLCGASHCHVSTGFRKKERLTQWEAMLGANGSLFNALPRDRVRMYGEGWEAYEPSAKYPECFPGPATFSSLMGSLSVAKISPVVAPEDRFITNKPVIIASRGCLPVMTCDPIDERHTWDPRGTVIDLGHRLRVNFWEDTFRLTQLSYDDRLELHAELKTAFKQDFSVIDQLVEDYHSGLYERDRGEWHKRYGGYFRQ